MVVRFTNHAKDKLAGEQYFQKLSITHELVGSIVLAPEFVEEFDDGMVRATRLISQTLSLVVISIDRLERITLSSLSTPQEGGAMRVKYYEEEDVLVLKLSDNPIAYAEEANLVVIHFDEKNSPTRIEILNAKRILEAEGFALPGNIKEMFFSPV